MQNRPRPHRDASMQLFISTLLVTMQQKLERHISGAIFPPCSKVCIITPFQLDCHFFIFCSLVTPLSLERKPAPNNPNTRENTYATTFKKTVLIQEKALHFHSAPLIYIVYKSATNMKLSDRLLANHITVSQLSVVVYIQIIFCNIMFFQLEAILWTKWLAKPRGF